MSEHHFPKLTRQMPKTELRPNPQPQSHLLPPPPPLPLPIILARVLSPYPPHPRLEQGKFFHRPIKNDWPTPGEITLRRDKRRKCWRLAVFGVPHLTNE